MRRLARLDGPRTCAAATVAALSVAGCGDGGERRDAAATGGPYTVEIERAAFPARQRLAAKTAFVLTVRNAGDEAIPNLVVTLRGFGERQAGSVQADPRRRLWLIDAPPSGADTAIEDAWAAGALAPGARRTLRWQVTPIRPGTHDVRFEVAPQIAGEARAQLAGGAPARGTVRVRVTGRPAQARVDPRTGRVIRRE